MSTAAAPLGARFLLWHRVRANALAVPSRIAVRDANGSLTYAELWRESGRVAAALVAHGIGRGDRVGMLLPKSAACVSTMLGILRSGAAYVPVDPRAPAARAAFVLRNARVRAVVGRANLLAQLDEHREDWTPDIVIVFGAGQVDWMPKDSTLDWTALADAAELAEPAGVNENDPAYILYTSGSTGQPKGVVISHRNALTFVDWGIESFSVSQDDVLSNHAPHHFDLSVFDIYCALHTGACVSIVPDRLSPFAAELATWIEDQGISVWYSVPTALIKLLRAGQLERYRFPRLRVILFAGEVFPVKYLREVMAAFPRAEFHNLFGPTETNVCTWYALPRPLDESVLELSIGHVCRNMDAIILRDDGGRAGIGEEGELLIGGHGVMLGYWGLPERTNAVRIQNPLHSDYADPVHRTGDQVRIQPDGSFQFLGRRDHMIKTRGYRVELGEVEAALHAHAAVRTAVVAAIPHDELGSVLHAAVAPEDGHRIDLAELTSFLLHRLARYAVPEGIHVFDDLPTTSTGKQDRTAVLALILAARAMTSKTERTDGVA